MPCELMEGCQFFNDNMKSLPKTAEYIKIKLCLGDYESCSRFRIYQEYGGENIPPYLDHGDAEEVRKATQCLRKKKECEGQ
jgi:hypothetical protein